MPGSLYPTRLPQLQSNSSLCVICSSRTVSNQGWGRSLPNPFLSSFVATWPTLISYIQVFAIVKVMSSYPHPTPLRATRSPAQTPAPKRLVESFFTRSKIEIVAFKRSARSEMHIREEDVAKRIVESGGEARSAKNGVRTERRV